VANAAMTIAASPSAPEGSTVVFAFDLAGVRDTWEAFNQQSDFGSTYTLAPKKAGAL
jgi:hypothetical protein